MSARLLAAVLYLRDREHAVCASDVGVALVHVTQDVLAWGAAARMHLLAIDTKGSRCLRKVTVSWLN